MLGCTGTGIAVGMSWKKRCEQLERIRQSLCMLHGEIRYMGEELPETFEHLAERTEVPLSEFYTFLSKKMKQTECRSLKILWQEGIERYLSHTYLKKDEKTIFRELGGQLGYLDRKMQLSSIENCLVQLEDKIKELKKCQQQKQKLSVTFGLLTGFFLMILFM